MIMQMIVGDQDTVVNICLENVTKGTYKGKVSISITSNRGTGNIEGIICISYHIIMKHNTYEGIISQVMR